VENFKIIGRAKRGELPFDTRCRAKMPEPLYKKIANCVPFWLKLTRICAKIFPP